MIVKIQMSQFSSDNAERVLIYDESKEFMYETEKPEEVKPIEEMMNGNSKAFFNAEIVDTKLNILSVADWQDW